ncbi:sodium-translocating pyrophosphatase [Akkermansiaceae bacterium]|nr:sodium-translocating pyrophosphatase [Akkermansiaceae bacterium]
MPELITPVLGLIGLAFAFLILRNIVSRDGGEGVVADIAEKIHRGAMVFMRREFKLISYFAIVIGLALFFFQEQSFARPQAFAFFLGCLASSAAGFIGMYTATKANVRTALAAKNKGAAEALTIAFFGGSVMGLTVASMGLIGLGGLFAYFNSDPTYLAEILEGFAMGASLVALFYRVGGGIFTKAADVGADLVGKVEAGIPEDDPRNPGVIADNVGDNVGDVAGMGSDIFESYCGAQIATVAIGASLGVSLEKYSTGAAAALIEKLGASGDPSILLQLPLILTTVGLICSILGIFLVRTLSDKDPAKALRYGTIGSAVLFIIATFFTTSSLGLSSNVALAVLTGAVGGIIIGLVTEHFTGGAPVREIARQGETGVATLMISGLAVGLKSVVIPMLTIAATIYLSYEFAGLYGVGLAAVGMLGTVGITMAIDAYGPVADNAGGIAEMAKMGPETRKITDGLDAVGNTTAAIGKGFAIGAAGLAALALITAFIQKTEISLDLSDPDDLRLFFVGLMIGGAIPFLNGAITMNAVGEAAFDMITEIRRQFREIPGLLEGTAEPETDKCIDIATAAATRRMIGPALLAVGTPLIVGFGFEMIGAEGAQSGAKALAGTLIGALLGCVLLALMMSNAGGAWDNAKKYVEEGNHGGKGSDTHTATVVGDTVGDPLKDTSGPSMNILINVMAIVSLVIAGQLSAG